MNKLTKIITEVKSKSGVDDFDYNLEKKFEDLIYQIAEDIRCYGSDSVCDFKQEELSKYIITKYIKD